MLTPKKLFPRPVRRRVKTWLQTSLGLPARLISINERYDLETVEVMRRVLRPDSNCIDVGCNVGSILDSMLELSPHGTHLGLEPIPDLHRNLVTKYKGRAEIRDVAASDRAGTSSFNYVVSNPAYSGLIKRSYDRPHEEDTSIEVRTERLDALIPADRKIALIKIDVEGGELRVLRGASAILDRDHPIVLFEHGLGAADRYGTTPEEIRRLFDGHGYELSAMEYWLRDCPPLSPEEFGAHFHKRYNYFFIASPRQ